MDFLGDHWFITVGQIILGTGIIALLIVTLSTHLVTRTETKNNKKQNEEILGRIETIENKIKQLHSLHDDVNHTPKFKD